MNLERIRSYIRLAIGVGLFMVAVYEIIITGATVIDTQTMVTGLLGIYFVIDVALRIPNLPNDTHSGGTIP
jgi:hypothetical protein